MSTKNDEDRYDVSGRYASSGAATASCTLPIPTAARPTDIPSGSARRAVTLSIPTPALDRGRAGRRELHRFVDRLDQGCEVAGAIARFNGAQEHLEKSTQSLEQTFARGAAELGKLERQLTYEGESLSLQYAHHLAELRQGVVDEHRRNTLADTEFEIAKATQAAALAEAREQARTAEVLAGRRAAAKAAEATAEQLQQESHVENARRKVNLAKGRRLDSEFHEDDADAGVSSPHLTAALRSQTERTKIKREAEARRRAVRDRVGGTAHTLSDDDQYEIESITQAEEEALKQFDVSKAGIRFDGDDEEHG